MKQTAVEWFWLNLTDDLIGDLAPEKILKIHELIEQAKAMEKEQSHKYAEFAIRCDRMDMKILNFEDFIKLETKSE